MKSSDEMFEKLGFEKVKEGRYYGYEDGMYAYEDNDGGYSEVKIDTPYKTITIFNATLTKPLVEAINRKCREEGWWRNGK